MRDVRCVACCLKPTLPGRQYDLSKRAGGYLVHGVAPNSDSPIDLVAEQGRWRFGY
jgi:hypothetical protein